MGISEASAKYSTSTVQLYLEKTQLGTVHTSRHTHRPQIRIEGVIRAVEICSVTERIEDM